MTISPILSASMAAGALTTASMPAAADIGAGIYAWSGGDHGRAMAEGKGPDERGDADARFNLAQVHKLGRVVSVDLARAEELFDKTAASFACLAAGD